MNIKEKSSHRKLFVRNTEQILPSAKVSETTMKTERKSKISPKTQNRSDINPTIKFDGPQMHSTNQIQQKIKTVEKMKSKKVSSTLDIVKNQHLILGEKITKQVNFPYEQPIYKDLIPLCIKMQSQPTFVSRDPLPLKDKEPILSDFYKPKKMQEYKCTAQNQIVNKGQLRQYKGLKLYSVMQNWSIND